MYDYQLIKWFLSIYYKVTFFIYNSYVIYNLFKINKINSFMEKLQKPFGHDRLLQEMFLYTYNKYPETRGLYFHVQNESRPIDADILFPILTNFLKNNGLFLDKEKVSAFIRTLDFGKEHIIRMARNKAIGTIPGVCDHLLYWRQKLYAFDAKIFPDTLSAAQKAFIEKIGGTGYAIFSIQEFKSIFDKIMESK